MRRTDVIKILFICLCVCSVCPAHPCGENPMRFVDNFSRTRGVASVDMLQYMRLNTPSDYSAIMSEYRKYLDCTQMVQNGYFKRSVDHVMKRQETLSSSFQKPKPNGIMRILRKRAMPVDYETVELPVSENTDFNINNFVDLDFESGLNSPSNNNADFSDMESAIDSLPILIQRILDDNSARGNHIYLNSEPIASGSDLFPSIRHKRTLT